jgi:uncharacterized membrane protein required for colicin V production
MYWTFFFIISFAATAMMVKEGLWSNTITLVTIIVAGLIAFGFYSPLVVYLDESVTDGQHTYWLDFAVLWALYAFTFVVLRTFTSACSKTRMRFKNPIDTIGGPALGFIASLILGSFFLATLHVSPMPKDAYGGKLVTSSEVETASFLSKPDAVWLRLVERMSAPTALGSGSTQDFSAKAWVKIYADRRAAFEKSDKFIPTRTKS